MASTFGYMPTGVALMRRSQSSSNLPISRMTISAAGKACRSSADSASAAGKSLFSTLKVRVQPAARHSYAIVRATPPQPQSSTWPESGIPAVSSAFKKP